MSGTATATLYYVHDPMCSWCYGFAPVWQQLQNELPDQVRVVSLVGGLAPDSDEPMPMDMQDKLQQTWRRIMQTIPGTRFNFDFWTRTTPRRSTYPACRAALCARLMADRETEMTAAIRRAYYREAKNPSDLETLEAAAVSIGLDVQQFSERMQSAELEQTFRDELERVRSLGVYSFPSLVIEAGPRRREIPIDYNSALAMLAPIKAFIAV